MRKFERKLKQKEIHRIKKRKVKYRGNIMKKLGLEKQAITGNLTDEIMGIVARTERGRDTKNT